MPNPLFNMFSGNNQPNQNGNMIQRFQEFLNNFKGDPRQKVQELLNSGAMTQDQFNQYSGIADQITGKNNRK